MWGSSREKTDRRHKHKGVVQLQSRRDYVTDPETRQRCALLLVLSRLCSQCDMPFWRKYRRVPAGDREEALVHRRMLSGAGRRHNDLGRGVGDGGENGGGF